MNQVIQRVPPLAWVAIGLATQRQLSAGRRPTATSGAIAALAATLSIATLGSAVRGFRRHNTTVDPVNPERVSRLVADGPFGISRNPMYVAMAGVLAAHAIARRSPAAWLPVAAFVQWMNKSQIEAEEQAMRVKFGAEFDDYAASVPRWIDRRSFRRLPG